MKMKPYFTSIAVALSLVVSGSAMAGDKACSAKAASSEAETKSACSAKAASSEAESMSIVATASEAGMFNTLLAAAGAAGLADTLNTGGDFTVFAPTDDAFAKLPAGTVEALLADPDQLRSILMYHVVDGRVMANAVVNMDSAVSLTGQLLSIDTKDGVKIDNASVIKADIECSNGVIHVIDSVLLPKNIVEFASATADFSTLVAAVQAAGLVDVLAGDGPFTVFAPTNAAFSALPEGTVEDLLKPENKDKLTSILTYHVVPGHVTAAEVINLDSAATAQGSKLTINTKRNKAGDVKSVHVKNAKVIQTDLLGSNGIIHVIDSVLIP